MTFTKLRGLGRLWPLPAGLVFGYAVIWTLTALGAPPVWRSTVPGVAAVAVGAVIMARTLRVTHSIKIDRRVSAALRAAAGSHPTFTPLINVPAGEWFVLAYAEPSRWPVPRLPLGPRRRVLLVRRFEELPKPPNRDWDGVEPVIGTSRYIDYGLRGRRMVAVQASAPTVTGRVDDVEKLLERLVAPPYMAPPTPPQQKMLLRSGFRHIDPDEDARELTNLLLDSVPAPRNEPAE